jgi:hypothetical protein
VAWLDNAEVRFCKFMPVDPVIHVTVWNALMRVNDVRNFLRVVADFAFVSLAAEIFARNETIATSIC